MKLKNIIKNKIKYTMFLIAVLWFLVPDATAYAQEISKTVDAELPQDYLQCTFYVTFENELLENAVIIAPNKKEYPMEKDEENNCLKCTLKDVAAGTYKVKITKEVEDGIQSTTKEEYDNYVNSIIGKVTLSVKSEEESKLAVSDNIKITKEIDGLQVYWKDDSIVAEWNDESCGNVDITIVDSKTLQILDKQKVKSMYYEYEVDQDIEEILIQIVPSASNGVSGAGDEFVKRVDNYPNGTVEYETAEYTNKDTIVATVTLNETYSILYTNNDEQIGQMDTLSPGTYDIEIPTVVGNNLVKVYIVDENNNMRSTEISFVKDIEPPVLKIENDINGNSTYDDTINISGIVSDFDFLEFRNEQLEVDWDGTFEIEASLKEGENELILTAYDIAGNTASYKAIVTKMVVTERQIPWNFIFTIAGIVIIILLFLIKKKLNLNFNFNFKFYSSVNKNKENKVHETNSGNSSSKSDYICFGVTLLIYILLLQFVFQLANVKSGSMEPTIGTNEFVIGNRLAYVVKEPQRGDIITFKTTESSQILLKRIIGVPGDEISFIDGYVIINGQICDEQLYLSEDIETNSNETFIVPEDSYFVLGDNRDNSYDSRYWNNSYIKKSDIIAKLMFHIDLFNF